MPLIRQVKQYFCCSSEVFRARFIFRLGFKTEASTSEIVNGVYENRKESTSVDAKSVTESVDSAISKGSETTTTNVDKPSENGGGSETPIVDDSSIEKQSELTNDDTTSETEKDSSTSPAVAQPISSIQVEQSSSSNVETDTGKHKPDDLPKGETSELSIPKERQVTLTAKLRKALDTTAPFLREIMTDFHSFLHKTLLGTHGQEIMNDPRGRTLKNFFDRFVFDGDIFLSFAFQFWPL